MKNFNKVICIICVFTMLLGVSTINVSAAKSTPYKELTVPGDIQCYEFDNGGEGVGYYSFGTPNTGSSFLRPETNAKMFAVTDGICISMEPNAWQNYTVEVKSTGYYMPTINYSQLGTAVIALYVDDEQMFSTALETTESYAYSSPQEGEVLYLTEGKHVIKIKTITEGLVFFGLNLREVPKPKLSAIKTEGSYRAFVLPTKIEAEEYDYDSKSKDGKNNGGALRKKDVIDIYKINKNGEYNIRLSAEEYAKYTFEVTENDVFDFKVSAMGIDLTEFYFDEVETPIPVQFDVKNYIETKITSIYLEKGLHNVRIKAGTFLSVDFLKFSNSDEKQFVTLDNLNPVKDETKKEEKAHEIYKELYIDVNGNDLNDGSEATPFKTIGRARQEIAKLNDKMTGDIIVNVQSGWYDITETEKFTTEHSGKNGFDVIIRGTNSLNPPVLSGGKKVTGWEKKDDYIWTAPLDDVKEVRNLYVNGLMAQRARSRYLYKADEVYKEKGSEYIEDGLVVSNINFPKSIAQPDELELVWFMFWTCQRTPVRDMVYSGDMVTFMMDQPYFHWTRSRDWVYMTPNVGKEFFLENALELLDEPGEFYYDKKAKMIYYYPFAEENLKECETYVANTEGLFSVVGDSVDKRITNIIFDNLDIRHGAWHEVSKTGLVAVQADKVINNDSDRSDHGDTLPLAQFKVLYADGIQIKNCRFSNLGSGAISMQTGVSNSKIIGNVIHDISGTGIIVGSWDHNQNIKGMQQCHNIDIINNVIRRASFEFQGGTAISVYYEKYINILHNNIQEIPYSGISLGWGWGEEADFGNFKVSYNRIEDCIIPPIEDGGHIYNLGPNRGTEVSYNYLKKSSHTFYGGLYTDSGSDYMKWNHNVIAESPRWYLGGLKDTKISLQVDDNYSDVEFYDQYCDRTANYVLDGNWPDEALQIMNNAGVEKNYKRLLSGLDYPKWKTHIVKNMPRKIYVPKTGDNWYQAEDYKEGGEGIGYHKLQKGNNTLYRPGDVILYQLPDCIVVGTTFPGEWLQYDVTVPETATYDIATRVGHFFDDSEVKPRINIYVDDKLVVNGADIPKTASWSVLKKVIYGRINLTAGAHVVKIEFVDNGFNFDSFFFMPEGAILYENDKAYDEGALITEEQLLGYLDIKNHWAEKEILKMNDAEIIKGISSNSFDPEGTLTWEQATLLGLRLLGTRYKDDDWKLVATTSGLLSENVDMTKYITREEFVDMLVKGHVKKNKKTQLTIDAAGFTDNESISSEYRIHILFAKSEGIISGDEAGCFNPKSNLTRAEAAVILSRFVK